MIETRTSCIRELPKFKVLSVHHEPYAESRWLLQHVNSEPMVFEERMGLTLEEDEQLIGKEIEVQVYMMCYEILPTVKKEKIMSFESPRSTICTITGIYQDIIKSPIKTDEMKSFLKEDFFITYKLDSIFPVEVSEVPDDAKIGDCITMIAEATIRLPR